MTRRLSWRRRLRSVFLWHRYLGATAAFFLLIITTTGMVLNHSHNLGLDDARLDWPPLMRLYGLAPERPPMSFAVDGRWATALAGTWYLDGRPVAQHHGPAAGAVAGAGFIALAAAQELILITRAGEVIERLDRSALPAQIRALGRDGDQRLVIRGGDGTLYQADAAVIDWHSPESTANIHWSRSEPAPAGVREAVLRAYRGKGLPASRVLADIHSGRLFGLTGQLVMDLAGLALLLLIATGFYNWLRRRH